MQQAAPGTLEVAISNPAGTSLARAREEVDLLERRRGDEAYQPRPPLPNRLRGAGDKTLELSGYKLHAAYGRLRQAEHICDTEEPAYAARTGCPCQGRGRQFQGPNF